MRGPVPPADGPLNLDLFAQESGGESAPAQAAPAGTGATPGDASAGTRDGRPTRLSPDGEEITVPVYSVSDLNRGVRRLLEERVGTLWVQGEVASWKRHGSGHCYFSLRDAESQVRCVMFRSDAARLPTDPADGMDVRVLGDATLYEARGAFQLVVRGIETVGGEGLWRLAFERLRARLEQEGLLDARRKRPLPECPASIGVITSGTGAALRDIAHVIERRAPWVRLVFRHARVQGEGAAEEIAQGIELFGRHCPVDLLIVGRGGGSTEDLWAFNEERVARAIAASPIPVISAVGHETDVSISDLVADLRAPTPSAAAECAVPDREDVERTLGATEQALRVALRETVARRARRADALRVALERGVREHVRARRERMLRVAGKLEALSPLSSLERGYAVPLTAGGRVLRRRAEFTPGLRFRLRVRDGAVDCEVPTDG